MFKDYALGRGIAAESVIRISLALVILWIPRLGQAQIDQFREMFSDKKYEALIPGLKDYRQKLKEKGVIDLQVDFMLSVSMCRIATHNQKGLRALHSLKKAYRNLSSDDLRIIDSAIKSCDSGTLIVTRLPTGGSRVTGKGGQRSEIQSQLSDMWSDRYRKRLFPRTDKEQAAKSIRRLVGDEYNVIPSTHFLLVSEQLEPEIRTWGRTMERVLAGFLDQYQMASPKNLITVYLFADRGLMAEHAERIHGIRISQEFWAYTFPQDSSITILTSGGMGTIGHEVFHVLLDQYSPYAPPWLAEGAAALYEEFKTVNGKVEGTFRPGHWRVPYVSNGNHLDLQELLEMDWVVFDWHRWFKRTHASAKFFAMYLQEKGLIERVVNGFKDYDPIEGDEDAIVKLEKLIDMKVSVIKQNFDLWMASKVGAKIDENSQNEMTEQVSQNANMSLQRPKMQDLKSNVKTKKEIIEEISKNAGISSHQAEIALTTTLDSIIDGVKVGGKVTLVGFGTFKKVRLKARKGRNSQTGVPIEIKARNVVKFRPGKKFREEVY
jgi:DNA-binding protein HU-beta